MVFRLGCTSLTPEQNACLRDEVYRKRVLDIGCGAGHLAIHMRDTLGASSVTGVDKEHYPSARSLPLILESFSRAQIDYAQFDVGVVAWPTDAPDLIRILEGFTRLVVVSKTTGGTMCGSHRLWTFLCGRELLNEVRDRTNTLLVYGAPHTRRPVARCEEEACGLLSSHLFPQIPYGTFTGRMELSVHELLAAAEGLS